MRQVSKRTLKRLVMRGGDFHVGNARSKAKRRELQKTRNAILRDAKRKLNRMLDREQQTEES